MDERHANSWSVKVAPAVTRSLPVVAHKGPNDTDASMFERAAWNLEHGYPVGGGNVTDAVVRLIRREVAAANQQVSEVGDA